MTTRINFIKKTLDHLSAPAQGKRNYFYDEKISGLAIAVTDRGSKTFVVYRKIQGRPERVTLGKYPDLTIEQARKKAAEILAAIAQGKNPNDFVRKQKQELTFKGLFDEYLERHAKVHKKSWKNDADQYRLYLSYWAKRKLSNFQKKDVQSLHTTIGKNHGHYVANRTLSLLHIVFNKAIEWGYFKGSNPAHKISRFKEKSRERFLQADELPRFFDKVANEENGIIRDYILMSLLTGARKSNVLAMRWEHVNLASKTWFIPETKNGSSQTVPLTEEAVKILEQRKVQANGEWVFPGPGKTGHLVEVKRAWARILERADIKGLRIHDLRRTLGSWQAATGANLSVIGRTLNHSNVSTTAIYARLSLDPIRQAMETATKAMLRSGDSLAARTHSAAQAVPELSTP